MLREGEADFLPFAITQPRDGAKVDMSVQELAKPAALDSCRPDPARL